jgi:hypothetical protein
LSRSTAAAVLLEPGVSQPPLDVDDDIVSTGREPCGINPEA